MSETEMPEDLGIRIGTPDQFIWESALKETSAMIESIKKALLVQTGIQELCLKKIEEEKSKVLSNA